MKNVKKNVRRQRENQVWTQKKEKVLMLLLMVLVMTMFPLTISAYVW